MDKTYQPEQLEQHWYKTWEERGYFAPQGDGDPYCIVIPPPNVTGRLHMGHGFQHAIMDALTRYHRMLGCQALWQVGTDHAGIATQMVVERRLNADGSNRHEIGRENFVKKVWEWKEESGDIITQQLRRMGSSLDWSRERFTMDEQLSTVVEKAFVDLYDEGLIYRGNRLVNWDPQLITAISDLEVVSEEETGSLWHFRYPIFDSDEHLVIATTRPETLLGDTAVAVHPEDERYSSLVGKFVELPLCNRKIPIIADEYVDPEFGTGCVKITPAHDFNDYEVGKRNDLEIINIFTDEAAINNNAPPDYVGLDRFDARKKILVDIEALGLLDKVEPHQLKVPRGDRSGVIIEPYLTHQWYVAIQSLADPAIKAVEDGDIEFVPKNWENTYFAWMRNIQDWCISRQLWWGHRIPAWYDEAGNTYVGFSEDEVRAKHSLDPDLSIRQDEDVLDTWFSSALWTFSTLGWPSKDNLLKKYHPTDVLVTGFDIIFFWVARMIMMTTHFISEVPFKKIFIHGLVKDSEGQKMSKSKGNILDPLDIIDGIKVKTLIKKRTEGLMQPKMKEKIEKQTIKEFPKGIQPYGTDALRLTYCSLASGSRDVNFDLKRVEGYRNFCNKLWNAARFINLQLAENNGSGTKESKDTPDLWIKERLNEASQKVNSYFEEFRFDLATQTIYDFIWNEFCDWYIEICKIRLSSPDYQESEKKAILKSLISTLEESLRLAHPIMPFITEEIWQQFKPEHANKSPSIMISKYPTGKAKKASKKMNDIEWVKEIVTSIRNIRGEMKIKPSLKISALLQQGNKTDKQRSKDFEHLIVELAGLNSMRWIDNDEEPPASAINFHKNLKVLIPLEGLIKAVEENKRIEKNIFKLTKESDSLSKQLNNDKFINNAPPELVKNQKERFKEISKELQLLDIQLQEIQKLL